MVQLITGVISGPKKIVETVSLRFTVARSVTLHLSFPSFPVRRQARAAFSMKSDDSVNQDTFT